MRTRILLPIPLLCLILLLGCGGTSEPPANTPPPIACGENADCDDGVFCNGQETCAGKTCQDGTNPCENDGLFCNGSESCDEENNQCTHSGDPCNDGNNCTNDSCSESTDLCGHACDAANIQDACCNDPACEGAPVCDPSECQNNADCDDGAFCNGQELCVGGDCRGGTNPCPNDGQFCNGTESCDEGNHQCTHSGDPCNDGNSCTSDSCSESTDSCNRGCNASNPQDACCNDPVCNGVSVCEQGECQSQADCDDGAFCNGQEQCVGGQCQAGTNPCPGDNLYCNGTESCNEATNQCTHSGDPCSDGNACTNDACNETSDSCTHTCNAAGPQAPCCSNAACTDAPVCQGGCTADGDCSDGLFCNGIERCVSRACQAGTAVTCNDSNTCTNDLCAEATDTCTHTCNAASGQDFCCNNAACVAAPVCQEECQADGDCSDGLFCNGAERCVSHQCQAGTAVTCNDGNGCTNDSCNENTDSCSYLCNANDPQDACCNNAACTGSAVCTGEPFPGGDYRFKITNVTQQPSGCLIGQALLPALVGLIGTLNVDVTLPAYTPYPFVFVLPLLPLGTFELEGTEFGTNEVIFPSQAESLDVGAIQYLLPVPGINCLISGMAEGGISPLDGATLPATIVVKDLVVGEGTGDGACKLLDNTPSQDCSLTLTMEGTSTGVFLWAWTVSPAP